MSDLAPAPAVLDKNDPNYDPDDPQAERQLMEGWVARIESDCELNC